MVLATACFGGGASPGTWHLDGDDTVVPYGVRAGWRYLPWLVVVKDEPTLWKVDSTGVPTKRMLELQRCSSSTLIYHQQQRQTVHLENVVLGSCIGSVVRTGHLAKFILLAHDRDADGLERGLIALEVLIR